MSLHSALFVGTVRHRRRSPVHVFTFPLFMVYLDLAELDRVLAMTRLWGRNRLCPARFRREDYLRVGGLGLEESVRARVHEHAGHRTHGPIRMLTHLRYFGYIFNPVTFYYCFDRDERLEFIVVEITNTPWNERHSYVLDVRTASACGSGVLRWRFGKEFHVSPFLPMGLEYDWSFAPPADSELIHMILRKRCNPEGREFDATLRLTRRALSPSVMRSVLVRFPLMTAGVVARIYLEAVRLWIKRAPVFSHPSHAARPDAPLRRGTHA